MTQLFRRRPAEQRTIPRAPEAGPPRVLCIDDSPVFRELICAWLDGWTVATADALSSARDALATSTFDLVLLDLHLPDSSGLQTLDRVRHHTGAAAIVVLTGDDGGLGVRAVRRGAQDYLEKHALDGDSLREDLRFAIERGRLEHARAEALRTKLELDRAQALERERTRFQEFATAAIAEPAQALDVQWQVLAMDVAAAGDRRLKDGADAVAAPLQRLVRGVRDLGELAAIEAGTLDIAVAPVDIGAAVEEAVLRHEVRARHNRLSLNGSVQRPGPALADRKRLDEVLDRLIDNAIRCTPAGGTITLRALAGETGPTLTVEDDGIGIDRRRRDRLFDARPMRREPGDEGLGIGLAIVKGVLDAMQAEISCWSRPDEGAVFQIDFNGPTAPA